MTMTLPTAFTQPCDYFKEVVHFLHQYSWIYEYSNTTFIKNGVLKQMPQSFKDYFIMSDYNSLNYFPYVYNDVVNDLMPEDVKNFRQRLKRLIHKNAYEQVKLFAHNNVQKTQLSGMSVKKQHEIVQLAQYIQKVLLRNDKNYILIEFGSGLGYLSNYLSQLSRNYFILGLEAECDRVKTSIKRLSASKKQKGIRPDENACIIYKQHYINEEETENFIEATISNAVKSNYTAAVQWQRAIIGLHACADLTITSMKLFYTMPHVNYLIIIPCCYHKLQMHNDLLKFRNFPLSETLRHTLNKFTLVQNNMTDKCISFLNRPFLRLACQQTIKRWCKYTVNEHRIHGHEMFERALAETIIDKQNEMLIKLKSKQVEHQGAPEDFAFENFTQRYQLKHRSTKENLSWQPIHKMKYEALIAEYNNENKNHLKGEIGIKLSEGLVCLQASMQKLCENVILYDRLCYMKEMAEKYNIKIHVQYEKLLDEEISPRCQALIARKL